MEMWSVSDSRAVRIVHKYIIYIYLYKYFLCQWLPWTIIDAASQFVLGVYLKRELDTQREGGERERESKTLFYKDYSLGSVKNLSNN